MLPITLLARTFGAKVLNVDLSQYDAQTVKTSKHSSTNTKSWSSKTMPISHPKGFSASPKNLAPQREPRIQPGRTYLVILVLRIHTRRIIQRDQMGGGSWHTDGPPREQTHWLSFLHAIAVPRYGVYWTVMHR